MPGPKNESCKICFFYNEKDKLSGFCRNKPPVKQGISEGDSPDTFKLIQIFPKKLPDEWCDKFKIRSS